MPSPENLRKLCGLIAGDNSRIRKEWYEALVDTRLKEKRREKSMSNAVQDTNSEHSERAKPTKWYLVLTVVALTLVTMVSVLLSRDSTGEEFVKNMAICDAAYFDKDVKKCTKHVDVFVHGVDEVFLSFDFHEVADGTPFERWWIHNGERVAGRTSFNDDAWPGYTFWRPGVLQVGQYVVRLVVNEKVTTQTFYVQAEGFTSE
jgi:hypothetical protein